MKQVVRFLRHVCRIRGANRHSPLQGRCRAAVVPHRSARDLVVRQDPEESQTCRPGTGLDPVDRLDSSRSSSSATSVASATARRPNATTGDSAVLRVGPPMCCPSRLRVRVRAASRSNGCEKRWWRFEATTAATRWCLPIRRCRRWTRGRAASPPRATTGARRVSRLKRWRLRSRPARGQPKETSREP